MAWLEIIVLAIVQALTEFLPISSSAHLYLASKLFGHGYQGLTFDLGLHLGTLAAVLIYFRQDWARLLGAGLAWRPNLTMSPSQRQLLGIALASIPAAVVGLAISKTPGLSDAMRNDVLIGINLIVCGALMWVAQRLSTQVKSENDLGIGQIVLIGLAQALALVPGVSRSGITMTAALGLGVNRESAARFSFLLAVPATGMAVAKGLLDMLSGGEKLAWTDFLAGAMLSGVFGYIVIHYFLALIRKIGVAPFTIYRVLVGTGLLIFAWLQRG